MTVEIRFEHFERAMNEVFIASMLKRVAFLYPSWLRTLIISITDTLGENGALCWSIGITKSDFGCIEFRKRPPDTPPRVKQFPRPRDSDYLDALTYFPGLEDDHE